jgi:hypothetical protein
MLSSKYKYQGHYEDTVLQINEKEHLEEFKKIKKFLEQTEFITTDIAKSSFLKKI